MRIISWNVNGIRALNKKGHFDWLINDSPDIFCLQETKAHPDQLPPELREAPGYEAYFDWAKTKKGYSGTAVYTKIRPEKVETEMHDKKFNDEGRLVTIFLKEFALCNVYFPNGGGGPDRLAYKLKFYDIFLEYIEKIRKSGLPIIFCGDVNTAHKEIDLARPKENEKNTGFLPEERAWIDKVISLGYVDVFRHFYPDKSENYTYWDMKTFSRDRNVGWRIDYFFTSPELEKNLKSTAILSDIFGSDHCPIELTLSF
jgi:exodeoxyribonuclease-3